MSIERNGYSSEELKILAEINDEYNRDLGNGRLGSSGLKVVSFESHSNGRGRPPRRSRPVQLFSYGGKNFISFREPDSIPRIDSIAQELYGDTLADDEKLQALLEEIERRLRE